MLDALVKDLKYEISPDHSGIGISDLRTQTSDRELRLAIIGRQRRKVFATESINRRRTSNRSPVAGTTRDAIDTLLATPEQKFRLIDTAGIRRKGKTGEMAELSVVMAMKSLARADVAIVIIDAEEGPTALDAHIAVTRTMPAVQSSSPASGTR